MKRYRMGITAVLLYAILTGSIPVFAQQPGTVYSVYVNGVVVSGAHPLIRDGIAYLPANTLAQALGVSIQWDARLNIVKVNDQITGARPLNENGSLLLPVETVAQALNGSVEWDGRTQAIRISSRPSSGSATAVTQPAASPVRVAATPSTPFVSATPYPSSTPSAAYPTVTVPSSTYPSTAIPRTPIVVSPSVSVTPVAVTPGPNYPATSYPTPSYPSSYSNGGTNTVQYPSPSAYPTSTPNPTAIPIRPPSAPPKMPTGLELPPAGSENGPQIQTTSPYANSGGSGVYVPKTAQNNVFAVTVTNIEAVSSIKDFYHPKPGYRFVIVYLSQQNVSNEVQIYTGRFSLLDQNNHSYDYVEGLSNFWLVILRPYGINFGYLVFELPTDSQATRLALHALNQSPLTLNL